MSRVEDLLLAEGCPKINVQVRGDNAPAMGFYHAVGFRDDDVVSLGRRLIPDGADTDDDRGMHVTGIRDQADDTDRPRQNPG